APALKRLSGEVADAELGVRGGEDVLAVPRRMEPAVHRLAGRAEAAGAPRDVLADLVARRSLDVRREDDVEGLPARRVAELAAREVARELRLPCGVQGRRELQRGKAL